MKRSARSEVDSTEACAQPLENQTSNGDNIRGGGAHDDAVSAGNQHARQRAVILYGDRFRDTDRPETTRIENIDLSSGRGLGDCTRECFAWSRSAAGIHIITDARDPCSGRLSA